MHKYILKRLCLVLVVILGVTAVTFSLMHFAPGDPAEVIAVARYGSDDLTNEDIDGIRASEGFDAPIYVQYLKWLKHTIQGDFGRSLITGEEVLTEILIRLPATFELAAASLIISLLISLPLGIASAVKRNTRVDTASMTFAMIGVSMPNFWLGLLLIWVFALTLGVFPVFGRGSILHLILPALTLGFSMAAVTARLTRSSMLDVLKQDYIITAKSKGLSRSTILLKHAFKNALIPIITIIGLQLGYLLEGAVVVETIFSWPGIGKFLVDSIHARDFTLIQGCVLIIAVLFSLVNLLVDILYAYLDPRIRYVKNA